MPDEVYDELISNMVINKLMNNQSNTNINWIDVCKKYILPDNIFDYVVKNVNAKMFKGQKWEYLTKQLVRKNRLDYETLDEYKYKLYWKYIVETDIVDDDFVLRYKDRINYVALTVLKIHRAKLSEDSIEILKGRFFK